MINQPYKIISKSTDEPEFGNTVYDNYTLEINNEIYLNFKIKTLGNVLVEENDKLDFSKIGHNFYYISTYVYNNKEELLTDITGTKIGGAYIPKKSITKAKDWLDKNRDKLLSGKGYQHKST
jgi:hypothetical protein